ncbi:hypothetical protein Hanom_Chr12g01110591 [Helianthus anomalus]
MCDPSSKIATIRYPQPMFNTYRSCSSSTNLFHRLKASLLTMCGSYFKPFSANI